MKYDYYDDLQKHPIEVVKEKIIERNPKVKNIIANMTKPELLTYLYTGMYEKMEFEGVATIFTACNQMSFGNLVNYIFSISLESTNILRIMITTLQNVEWYKKNKYFYGQLVSFKLDYERKFKDLLFDLGQNAWISKLELLEMFRKLICK